LGTDLGTIHPEPDVGEPRLFWREASRWLGLMTVNAILQFTGGDPPRHPAMELAIPPALFVFTLYVGLFRWTGAFVHLLWLLLPYACVVVPAVCARHVGGVAVPLVGGAGTLAITVLSAERLRRRSKHDGCLSPD
jgi:hypothetical protein